MNRISTLRILLVFLLVACVSKEAYPTVPTSEAQVTETRNPTAQSTANTILISTIAPTPNPTQTVTVDPLSSTKIGDGCLPPIETREYALAEGSPIPTPRADVLPVGWDEISRIPEEFRGNLAYIQLMRLNPGYDEIWVGINSGDKYSGLDDIHLIYRTDTKEWMHAPTSPGLGLFLDADNNVWSYMFTRDKTVPRLYRLEEGKNQFIPVTDKDNLLGNGHIVSSVKIDNAGKFWFLFRDMDDSSASRISLYSFNPSTREADRHSIGVGFDNLVIDEYDNIYLLQNRSFLVKFNPETGLIHSVNMPGGNVYNGTGLFIDRKGRLWVSDIARFDQAVSDPNIGDPTLIPRSPIFIRFFAPYGRYIWFRPGIDVESIDGRLWYGGDAWFDPDKEEWCLFTTYESHIGEDSNHNLWMIAGDALYTYIFAR